MSIWIAIFRYSFRRSELVVISMLGLTGVVHAGKSFGDPVTSTMHKRQPPYGVKPSRLQSVGINMPLSFAALRIVVPSGTET
jgi:hypothetical protein